MLRNIRLKETSQIAYLLEPIQINCDSLNNIRLEASNYFRNKKSEYLKDKIDELETNCKTKNIRELYRGINELRIFTSLAVA
jgi:hypothetical protein